jgi:UPF0755 protein
MSRLIRILIVIIAALGACVILCGVSLFLISGGDPVNYLRTAYLRLTLAGRQADINRSMSADETPIRFNVSSGDTPRLIAQNLFNQGLIRDPSLFVDYVRINDYDTQLEAGVYFLSQSQTLAEIATALTDSRSSQFPFRILEGWRMEEVAEAIDNNPYFGFSGHDFLAVVGVGSSPDPDFAAFVGLPIGSSLEGFLFPNTYQLPAQVTPEMLRDFLTDEFMLQVGTELQADALAQGLSLHDVVTLASIVQREAVHDDESPLIASAYRNRMDIGMKLDADPTVQYPLGISGNWWPQITQADYVNTISPFNTYLNIGLPPAPIANPGLAAISGVIYPQTSPYIYFRARCDGSGYHVFAETFEEHVGNEC